MTQLLQRVHRETGVTVLHITHNRHEARALAKLMIVIKDGQVLEGDHAGSLIADLDNEM